MARNFGELVDAVVRKDFESESDIEDDIKEWLNDAYMRIARKDLKEFRTTGTITTVANTMSYSISSNLSNYRKMRYVFASEEGDITWQTERRANQLMYGRTASSATDPLDTDLPEVAWEDDGSIYFYPVPDDAYTITCKYYQVPDRMSSDSDTHLIPSEYEELLVNYAKAVYDFREKDYKAVDRAKAEFYADLNQWVVEDEQEAEDSEDIVTLQKEYNQKFRTRKSRL